VRRVLLILTAIALFMGFSRSARGDVGIVLNESLDTSVARVTGSGHTAVYFSRICPASAVELHLCAPGEQGSVMSNYTTLGEDKNFEWNITPLSMYLYGVSRPEDRPLFGTRPIKEALEEHYRQTSLAGYCETESCRTNKDAEWREMVDASAERTIYILIVPTTVEQDKALIAKFNDRANVNHFNGMTHNCADFARFVVNTYFPHATHRNFLNDFGMSSPKGITRSFAHYAHAHPEMNYQVVHFAQTPGTLKRSTECREGTEQLVRSKKLLVPMLLFASHAVPFVATSYVLTGRFNPQREFEEHASFEETRLDVQIRQAKLDGDANRASALKDVADEERSEIAGRDSDWAALRETFDGIVQDSIKGGVIPDRAYLGRVFKDLNEKGTPYVDDHGALWLRLEQDGRPIRVGLSQSNVLAAGSDRKLATQILLAYVDDILKNPPRRRDSMMEFDPVWRDLSQIQAQSRVSLAEQVPNPASSLGSRSLLP
jgi:hypothetical protein